MLMLYKIHHDYSDVSETLHQFFLSVKLNLNLSFRFVSFSDFGTCQFFSNFSIFVSTENSFLELQFESQLTAPELIARVNSRSLLPDVKYF